MEHGSVSFGNSEGNSGAADQVDLLRALIAGLDEDVDEDVERAWLEEAQRRHRELLNGTVTATPAEEVIAKAHARLKNES